MKYPLLAFVLLLLASAPAHAQENIIRESPELEKLRAATRSLNAHIENANARRIIKGCAALWDKKALATSMPHYCTDSDAHSIREFRRLVGMCQKAVRLAENIEYGITAQLNPKQARGDWWEVTTLDLPDCQLWAEQHGTVASKK